MKKHIKKSYYIYIILVISCISFIIYHFFLPTSPNAISSNANYSGIGQKMVSGKDGYFTTFTTFTGKTYKEYKQNGNSSWSEHYYWGGTMSENGCGITCLATLASGYGIDCTPEDLRRKYAPNKEDHLARKSYIF